MKLLISILAAAAVWTASGQGTFEAVEGYVGDPTTASLDGTAGSIFETTNAITVVALGVFEYLFGPGQEAIQVGLWDSSGTLIASNTITASSTLVNQTRYQSINPVFLGPGQIYHLGAYPTNGNWVNLSIVAPWLGSSAVTASEIALGDYASFDGAFASPIAVTNTAGAFFLAPNFEFQNGVPEPSSGLLLGLGGLLLAAGRKGRSCSRKQASPPGPSPSV